MKIENGLNIATHNIWQANLGAEKEVNNNQPRDTDFLRGSF